jgi:hypothetical protein
MCFCDKAETAAQQIDAAQVPIAGADQLTDSITACTPRLNDTRHVLCLQGFSQLHPACDAASAGCRQRHQVSDSCVHWQLCEWQLLTPEAGVKQHSFRKVIVVVVCSNTSM